MGYLEFSLSAQQKYVCETCGSDYEEDEEQCILCGGEVVPRDD